MFLVCNCRCVAGKFQSLDIANADPTRPEVDNSEFDEQRKAVIKEALEQGAATKKMYGGIKQVCSPSVVSVDVGYMPPPPAWTGGGRGLGFNSQCGTFQSLTHCCQALNNYKWSGDSRGV